MNSAKWRLSVALVITDSDAAQNREVLALAKRVGPEFEVMTWRPGDPVSRVGDRRYRNHGVRIDIFSGDDGNPDECICSLIRVARALELDATSRQYKAQAAIALKLFGEETPPLGFSAKTIANLAAMGLSVDIDLYIWTD